MKHSLKVLGLSSLIISAFVACDRPNSRRMTPPETTQQVELKNEVTELKTSNAVDILFVIDNSNSMTDHQKNLATNIEHFVRSLENNDKLDYHIGITSVFDSVNYGPNKKVKVFNPNGYLLPLKRNVEGLPSNFYTRSHNDLKLLANSLLIGAIPLTDYATYQGPEEEEVFSPIYSAFTEPALSSPQNAGFYRPEARLAIIMITDADDSSPNLSGSLLYEELKKIKNDPQGLLISTFGLLTRKGDPKEGKCGKVDPGMGNGVPYRIIDFLNVSRGSEFSLCSNDFSKMLKQIGKEIQEKGQKQSFRLEGTPEDGTLRIFLGNEELEPGTQWRFDPKKNIVVVKATPKDNAPESKALVITYTKVNMQNVQNGRARRVEIPSGPYIPSTAPSSSTSDSPPSTPEEEGQP